MDHQPRDDSLDRHKCDQSVILDKKKSLVWCCLSRDEASRTRQRQGRIIVSDEQAMSQCNKRAVTVAAISKATG